MVRFDLIYHSSRIWAFLPKSMKSGASICLCLSTAEEHELTPSNGISSSLNIFDEPLSEKSNSSHFLLPLLPCMWLYVLSSEAHSLLSVSFKIWATHFVPHPPWPCFGSHVFVNIYINVAFDPEHSWSSWPRGEKAHHFSHSRHCTCLFSAQSDAPILISPFDANKCKFQCESGRLAGCRKGWVSVS